MFLCDTINKCIALSLTQQSAKSVKLHAVATDTKKLLA